ncbi:MAG: lamin tail domain-containing protein [Chitinophagaceae bacterium]
MGTYYFLPVIRFKQGMTLWALQLVFTALTAQPHHSVIIQEIMADPSPSVGLPNYEWIEIKNNSRAPLQLQNWRLADGSGVSGPLPSYWLAPDSLLIVCSNTAVNAMRSYGNVVGVSSFPNLDNNGETLVLRNSIGQTIHAVAYETSWYKNSWKMEGGWTLEMINPQFPCWGKDNWKASIDNKGGSPGKPNTVSETSWQDPSLPLTLHGYVTDSTHLVLVFNKTLDSSVATHLLNYGFTDQNLIIKSVVAVPPLFQKIILTTEGSFQKDSVLFLRMENIQDCKGASIAATQTLRTGWASLPQKGDWILNEILFNPRSSGVDFVECYNNSQRIIDLSTILFTNRQLSGVLNTPIRLSEEPLLIFPGAYKVFTEDIDALQREYLVQDEETVVRIKNLPSLPDAKGNLVMLNIHGNILDELNYNEDWHFPLLESKEGVSLERLRADAPTQNKNNWHSAASTEGFATPGRKNSQQTEEGVGNAAYHVHPKIFSPDMDGKDDLCTIAYQVTSPGQVATVSILNEEGLLVKLLVPRATLANAGNWNWNGLDDRERACPPGIYIIVIQQFGLDGKKQISRMPVIIARNF